MATSTRSISVLGRTYTLIERLSSNDHANSVWDAGVAFTRYMEPNPRGQLSNFRGKRVLELGSGTGLVAMFLAAQGAFVVATDLPHVMDNLTACIANNGFPLLPPSPAAPAAVALPASRPLLGDSSEGTILAAPLSWGDSPAELCTKYGPFDYVIGTDVVYDISLVRPLIRTAAYASLAARLDKKSTTVYFANEQRDSITHSLFCDVSRALFTVKELPISRLELDNTALHIFDMRLKRDVTAATIEGPLCPPPEVPPPTAGAS